MKIRDRAPLDNGSQAAIITQVVMAAQPYAEDIAAACDEAGPEPWERLELELQTSFFETRDLRVYNFPAKNLAALARPRVKRRAIYETGLETITDAELFDRLEHVHRHRGRGFSPWDRRHQHELIARSAGPGWVTALTNLELPRLYGLELGGGVARQRVVRAMQILDAQGWLGMYGSADKLAQRLGVSRSHWWRVVAWLCQNGWLIRLRTYKRKKHAKDGSVDLYRNWYGPGPRLLEWRKYYRSELSSDRDLFRSADRAQKKMLELAATPARIPDCAGAVQAEHLVQGYIASVRGDRLDEEAKERAQEIWETGQYRPQDESVQLGVVDHETRDVLEGLLHSCEGRAALEASYRACRALSPTARRHAAEAAERYHQPVSSCDRLPSVRNSQIKEGPHATATPCKGPLAEAASGIPTDACETSSDPMPGGCSGLGSSARLKSAIKAVERQITERFGSKAIFRPPD